MFASASGSGWAREHSLIVCLQSKHQKSLHCRIFPSSTNIIYEHYRARKESTTMLKSQGMKRLCLFMLTFDIELNIVQLWWCGMALRSEARWAYSILPFLLPPLPSLSVAFLSFSCVVRNGADENTNIYWALDNLYVLTVRPKKIL